MADLRSSHANLLLHIQLLTRIMGECLSSHATVYQFPDHTQEDIGVDPEVVPIIAHSGQAAIEKALLHYSHFQTDKNQPGAFVRKLAGTLLIECSKSTELEIRQRIEAINRMKQEFEQLILSLSPLPDVRFELFRNALPYQCKLSITRQIPVALPSIRRINYAWTNRKVGGNFKRDDLLNKIKLARSQPKPSDMMDEWLSCLDYEERLIASYPKSAVFIERRQSRVTAMMKLHYPQGHKPKETSLHAHSPLIIINDKPKISQLKTYIRPDKPEQPEAKYQLVIPRLCLYLLTNNGTLPEGSKRKIWRLNDKDRQGIELPPKQA
jgi:DNA replication terminus site-binding protein